MKRFAGCLLALMAVSGCMTAPDAGVIKPTPVGLASASMMPARGDVPIGGKAVPAMIAAKIFSDACLQPAASFDSRVPSLGFRKHAASGAYYNQTYDLSVVLVRSGGQVMCSMVFLSDAKSNAEIVATAKTVAKSVALQAGQVAVGFPGGQFINLQTRAR